MRPRPRLRWLYRPDALPAVEYGEFSYSGNKGLGRRSSSGHHTGGIRRPQHAGWLGGSADQPSAGQHSAGQHSAGQHSAAVTFVHVWLPSGPGFAAWPFPSDPLVLQWQDDAWQRMWHALDTAFGGLPPDLEAEPLVMRGDPARSWSARPAGTVTGWS